MVFGKKQNKTTDTTSKKAAFKKLADFLDWRESADRLAELQSQRRELQSTVTELESQVGSDDDPDGVKAQAAEMVSVGTAVAIAGPDVRVELNDKKQRLAVVIEAVTMQQKALASIKETCIIEMVQERRPAHAAIVQRMDAALAALEQIISDERTFRSQAVDDGLRVPDQIPMIPLPAKFGWQRGSSWENFHQWRIQMTRVGYLAYNGRT